MDGDTWKWRAFHSTFDSKPPKDFQFPIFQPPSPPPFGHRNIFHRLCLFRNNLFRERTFLSVEEGYIRMCQLQDSEWMAGGIFTRVHHHQPPYPNLTAILSDFKSVSDVTIMRDYFMPTVFLSFPCFRDEVKKKKRGRNVVVLNWNPSRVLWFGGGFFFLGCFGGVFINPGHISREGGSLISETGCVFW